LVVLVGSIAAMAFAGQARAADLYVDAVAGQANAATCQPAPPANGCDIYNAVENVEAAGDTIHVAPGDYNIDGVGIEQLSIDDQNVKLLGPGAGLATVTTGLPLYPAVHISAVGAVVSGLGIVNTASGANTGGIAFGLNSTGSVGDGLSVRVPSASATYACTFDQYAGNALRNSVCSTGGTDSAIRFATLASNLTPPTLELTNVTAYATGAGATALRVVEANDPDSYGRTVTVRNSILDSVQGNDIYASSYDDPVTLDLAYSAWADRDSAVTGTGSVVSSAPGAFNSITAPPQFTDTGATFHQAPTSPTIDKGTASALQPGALDIDGGARILGPAPDIGADEAPVTTPPPAGPTGLRAAALKKCKKKHTKKKRKKCKKRALLLPV
jgi:hypothetical protein